MQICSGMGLVGAANSTLLLTRELAKRDNRVSMVCRPNSWIGRELASGPVEVIWSDMHRWPPDELRRIVAMARERQTDVVNTHMSRAHFFGVLMHWLSGIPCVATAHCRKFQPHWMFNDYVIAVSESTRRYHQRYNLVRPSRIETIYNFVDPRWSGEVSREARTRIRAEFGADESCCLMAVVGTLIRRKGLIHLVRALPKMLQAAPNARLVAIGGSTSSRYAARVRTTAERLGVADRVVWAGIRHDMEHVWSAIDLLIHPALEEPLGRVLLEAMAAGVPVVASDSTGIRECVVHGTTGLLVPPANSDALAEAAIPLLCDPSRRRQLGAAGRRRVEEHFSPAVLTLRTEAVFRRAVEQRKAA
ncbi:MAG: glycosyltransferase family 4 protein [Planctomycetota bacterium]